MLDIASFPATDAENIAKLINFFLAVFDINYYSIQYFKSGSFKVLLNEIIFFSFQMLFTKKPIHLPKLSVLDHIMKNINDT